MRLLEAAVDRYGPLGGWNPTLGDGLTVLSGPNESGKTLYLEALLRLLEPGVTDVLSPGPRVEAEPTGRVVVEHAGEHHECDGDTALSDVSPIEPAHLHSVFVVRDADLALPDERAYYTSLVERLGDIHTTEIGRITDALRDRGRLTDARLDVSSDREYHGAGDVRDEAAALASEIRAYVETVEAAGLDELDAQRLDVKRELRDARGRVARQEDARTLARHDSLSTALETYRSASERLADLAGVGREGLDELRELERTVRHDETDLDETKAAIEEQRTAVAGHEERIESLRAERADLERRDSAVDAVGDALETTRDRIDAASGAGRHQDLARNATLVAIASAGLAGVAGALSVSVPAVGLGVLLTLVAVASGLAYRRLDGRRAAAEQAREDLLRTARDAGFEVDDVDGVAPALEQFRAERERVTQRLARAEQDLANAEERLEALRAERDELQDELVDRRRTIRTHLEAAGVESVEAYAQLVEEAEGLQEERRLAARSLEDRFGDPGGETPEERAGGWERDLEGLLTDVEREGVSAAEYDEDELAEATTTVAELEDDLDELEAQLRDYDATLDEFDGDATALDTEPFVGETLTLPSRSRRGLEVLASDLESVVEAIERDAELSRKAIGVFEAVATAEEQKLADLFDPDGPASRTFERLTDGRYTGVAYDAEDHGIVVERADGRTFGPRTLSQGTRDQLYFASRVSLATQLLGAEPGVLLLDDPFVAADPDRLVRGFESLLSLADDGWQICYCTAKGEVGERMVEQFDLDHVAVESVAAGEPSGQPR